jgi:hypothetical protein
MGRHTGNLWPAAFVYGQKSMSVPATSSTHHSTIINLVISSRNIITISRTIIFFVIYSTDGFTKRFSNGSPTQFNLFNSFDPISPAWINAARLTILILITYRSSSSSSSVLGDFHQTVQLGSEGQHTPIIGITLFIQ